MSVAEPPARPAIPTAFAAITLASVAVLLAFDAWPRLFAADVHDSLAAVPLLLIAIAYLVYQGVRRASPAEWGRAAIVALAFVFWAANQLCADHHLATLFNDVAIALFVLDLFLVIVARPPEAAVGEG
jgi:hypothetical protein